MVSLYLNPSSATPAEAAPAANAILNSVSPLIENPILLPRAFERALERDCDCDWGGDDFAAALRATRCTSRGEEKENREGAGVGGSIGIISSSSSSLPVLSSSSSRRRLSLSVSMTEKAENIPCDEEEYVGAANIADMERWRAVVDVALFPPRDVSNWNEDGG